MLDGKQHPAPGDGAPPQSNGAAAAQPAKAPPAPQPASADPSLTAQLAAMHAAVHKGNKGAKAKPPGPGMAGAGLPGSKSGKAALLQKGNMFGGGGQKGVGKHAPKASVFARAMMNQQAGGSSSSSGVPAGVSGGGPPPQRSPFFRMPPGGKGKKGLNFPGSAKQASTSQLFPFAKQPKGQALHETQPDSWKTLDPRVSHPIPSLKDKWRLVGSFLEAKGLISCQLDNFNRFLTTGISEIVIAGGTGR